jgi:hypothetical protein
MRQSVAIPCGRLHPSSWQVSSRSAAFNLVEVLVGSSRMNKGRAIVRTSQQVERYLNNKCSALFFLCCGRHVIRTALGEPLLSREEPCLDVIGSNALL